MQKNISLSQHEEIYVIITAMSLAYLERNMNRKNVLESLESFDEISTMRAHEKKYPI